MAIARLCAVSGMLVSTALALWLVPQLSWLGDGARLWQAGMLAGALMVSAGLYVWTGLRLAALATADIADQTRRRAAHDYPFRLARVSFVAAIGGGVGTTAVLWIYVGSPSQALVGGVITYLLMVLPVLGVYLGTRRALRAAAAGPPGAGPVGGLRQTVALRLAFAVQLPAVVCAAGIVLVEQSGGYTYGFALEDYYRQRYDNMLGRVLRTFEDEERRRAVASVQPPEGVQVFFVGPVMHAAHPPDDFRRPAALRYPPYATLALVTVLSALLGAWLASEVTGELRAVRRALAKLRRGSADVERLPERSSGLAEATLVATALQRTLNGFAERQRALREAAGQRRDAQHVKGRFLAHLSHELKSPLNSILGFSEVLLSELDGPVTDSQRDQLTVVWRCGESLLRYILALLDLARLDAPGSDDRRSDGLRPEPTDAATIGAAIEQQHRADPTGRLMLVVTDDGGACMADPNYAPRALLLAGGVLLDGVESGLVEIRLEPDDGGLRATISALHAEGEATDRARLVAALEQAGPEVPTDRPTGAVGLAVALLHRVVVAHGGRVAVTVDEWPRFEVWLPGAPTEQPD